MLFYIKFYKVLFSLIEVIIFFVWGSPSLVKKKHFLFYIHMVLFLWHFIIILVRCASITKHNKVSGPRRTTTTVAFLSFSTKFSGLTMKTCGCLTWGILLFFFGFREPFEPSMQWLCRLNWRRNILFSFIFFHLHLHTFSQVFVFDVFVPCTFVLGKRQTSLLGRVFRHAPVLRYFFV